jgi:hypothetical protein
LIVNTNGQRLALADVGGRAPRLIDVDRSTPSVTHLRVEGRPIDVAASPDGSAAHVLRSVAGDIAIVDLWRIQRVERRLSLPGTPKVLTSRSAGDGASSLIAGLHDPDQLWFHPPITCRNPADGEPGCSGFDAEATELPVPGRISDLELGPRERRLYVTYRNRAFLSVVALSSSTSLADRGLQCRGARTSPPCEVERVGLTTGCSDGVDNDGDGEIDENDPQCFGPKGAESPEGIGRVATGPCVDGVDNDGDGDVDREDPECQSPAQPSESEPLVDVSRPMPCDNGEDDDGDGRTDAAEDPGCYGPSGSTETETPPSGATAVSAGPMGRFVYVADGSDSQILTIDAERLSLIDTARAKTPSAAAFGGEIGISIGDQPASVVGTVDREVVWTDPENASHGIVRYRYGVYAPADDGRLYRADAAEAYCEVTESDRDALLTNSDFRLGSEAFVASEERRCVTTPAFPIEAETPMGMDDPCQSVEACRTCLETDGEGSGTAEACSDVCSDFQSQREACRVQGRRLDPSDATRLVVNPTFSLRDRNGTSGELRDAGTCTEPNAYLQTLREFVDANPDAPTSFGCFSSLRPQPLSRFASDEALDEDTLDAVPRADLLTQTDLVLEPPTGGDSNGDDGGEGVQETIVSSTYDRRVRNENWRVVYEGVLPGTRRGDGLLVTRDEMSSDDASQSELTIGGLDLCRAGVREGDRLKIRTSPRRGSEAPEACRAFRNQTRVFGIEQVRSHSVTLVPLDDSEEDPDEGSGERDEADSFPARAPFRECFPEGLKIEIRPDDEWIVVGSESGFVSSRTSSMGVCIPRFGGDDRRRGGRVETGEIFTGPYLEFRLREGRVEPIRNDDSEFSYQFRTRRAFTPSRSSIGTLLPSDAGLFTSIRGGDKLMISDASNDTIFVRNLGIGGSAVLR